MSVLDRLSRCVRCRADGAPLSCSKCMARFCSRDCQRADHRGACRAPASLDAWALPAEGDAVARALAVPGGGGGGLLQGLGKLMLAAYGTTEVEIYDLAVVQEGPSGRRRYITMLFDECCEDTRANRHLAEAGIYGRGDVLVFSSSGSSAGIDDEHPEGLPPLEAVRTALREYAPRLAWVKDRLSSLRSPDKRDAVLTRLVVGEPFRLTPGMRALGCVASLSPARVLYRGAMVEIDPVTLGSKHRTLAAYPGMVMVPFGQQSDAIGYSERVLSEVKSLLEDGLVEAFVAEQRAKRAAGKREEDAAEEAADECSADEPDASDAGAVDECSVCLDELDAGDARGKPCPNGHSTCAACWAEWRSRQAAMGVKTPTCVICRAAVKKKAKKAKKGKKGRAKK